MRRRHGSLRRRTPKAGPGPRRSPDRRPCRLRILPWSVIPGRPCSIQFEKSGRAYPKRLGTLRAPVTRGPGRRCGSGPQRSTRGVRGEAEPPCPLSGAFAIPWAGSSIAGWPRPPRRVLEERIGGARMSISETAGDVRGNSAPSRGGDGDSASTRGGNGEEVPLGQPPDLDGPQHSMRDGPKSPRCPTESPRAPRRLPRAIDIFPAARARTWASSYCQAGLCVGRRHRAAKPGGADRRIRRRRDAGRSRPGPPCARPRSTPSAASAPPRASA